MLSALKKREPAEPPIWAELFAGVELGFLWISPVFLGFGIPHGDGSGVVVVPGFLGNDLYLSVLSGWLRRVGYRPYTSGITFNADCPNLLIREHLRATVEEAYHSTKKRVHVIGHSLGGTMARAIAGQMPDRVASVITLGAPIRTLAAHAAVLRTAELVRKRILKRHGSGVFPACYTPKCTCNFLESIMAGFPASVGQTAIYTKFDGIMDWRACLTGDPDVDMEVSSTHLGLVFSPLVYSIVAKRLAKYEPRTKRRAG